jgi:hypothetical protein
MLYALFWISFSKPAAEIALDACESLILLCGFILAIGAAGEYIEEHGRLPEWMKWSRRPRMVFVWMVALSLIGEFVGDAGVFVFSGRLQTISDSEVAELYKKSSLLDLRRVELQAKMLDLFGPRKLTKEKAERIARKLSKLAGARVDVFVFSTTAPWNRAEAKESIEFANAILDMFVSTKMDAEGWIAGPCKSGAGAANVSLNVRGASVKDIEIATEILRDLSPEMETFPEMQRFPSVALACTAWVNMREHHMKKPNANIQVLIGRRTTSVLKPEMLETKDGKNP